MKQYVEINVIREQIGERFGFPIEDVIEDLPIADVQPVKRGQWVQIGKQSAKCSECNGVLKSNGIDETGHANIFNAVYHYCPYCGAKMTKQYDEYSKYVRGTYTNCPVCTERMKQED